MSKFARIFCSIQLSLQPVRNEPTHRPAQMAAACGGGTCGAPAPHRRVIYPIPPPHSPRATGADASDAAISKPTLIKPRTLTPPHQFPLPTALLSVFAAAVCSHAVAAAAVGGYYNGKVPARNAASSAPVAAIGTAAATAAATAASPCTARRPRRIRRRDASPSAEADRP
jgi:hypothetical protein